MTNNESYDDHILSIAETNKDIYKVFKSVISRYDLEAIMVHILEYVEFNTYKRQNTAKEKNDYMLLESMENEVLKFIENFKIDYSTFQKATNDCEQAFILFSKSKLKDRELANKLQRHESVHLMRGILKIILWHNLSLQAYSENYYLLAYNNFTYCSVIFEKLKDLVCRKTPYQEYTQNIRLKALDLAEIIWSYDISKILLRKHVAELIIEILHNLELSIAQVDKWLKNSEVVPEEILERYRNHDYGNTKAVKKSRDKLKAEIILKIRSSEDDFL